MAEYHIKHITRYTYAATVIDCSNQVMLYPLNDSLQIVKSHELKISNDPEIRATLPSENKTLITTVGQDAAKPLILLVEDNPFNQMVAVDTLTDMIGELTIDVAENGKIAVDKVSENEYDIVLMDIQMPEMDGFEATLAIRSMPEPRNMIPIMAMTANVTSEELAKCFEAGMNEYISKPFDTQDLINKIGRVSKR